jgi:hypothetical protein
MKYVFQPPSSDSTFVPENVKLFYKFIFERQRIWHKRFMEHEDPPWTDDTILAKYKYTNVYRELDRGTIWLMQNIMPEFGSVKVSKKKLRNILWKICQYRLLNKIETFESIGLVGYKRYQRKSHDGFFERLYVLRDSGVKVWTDAHITLQCNLKQDRLKNFEYILDKLHSNIPDLVDLLIDGCFIKDFFDRIKQEYGFGPFISYEVTTDLSYANWNNIDQDEWANPGPGCQFGLKLIFPQMKTQEDFQNGMVLLRNNQPKVFKKYHLDFRSIWYNNKWLTLRNIEHSLCEWGKYWKQSKGVGKARTIFKRKTF